MTDEEKKAANQILEGGAQEEAANQNAEGSAQQAGTEDAAGAGQKEEEGLKAAVVAEQKRRQEAENRAVVAEQQAQAYQQLLTQKQQPQQEQIDPEGYVQFKDMQQQQAQMMQAFQLQQIRTTTPDLDEVIGPGAGQQNYQASEQVKKLIQNNPSLYYGLDRVIATGNPQAISIAYQLVKQQEKVEELEKVANAAKEQSELINSENKTNPMSPAAAGGGGGMSATSQIPPADSPEFDAMWEKVKAGEFDQT
jgi:hypothetical protein